MLVAAESSSVNLYNFALFAAQTGRPGEVLRASEQVDVEDLLIRIWPDYWTQEAKAHYWLSQYEEGLETARAGTQRFPENLPLRRREIQALIALGRLEEIDPLLDDLETMEPVGSSSPGWMFRLVSGDLARFGHTSESRAIAERAVEWYQARDPDAYQRPTAQALILAGRAEEAMEIIGPLAEERPDSLRDHGIHSIALALTGDTTGAESKAAWFEALDRPYMFGENTYWRAAILSHLGRLDEAVILLRQAYREGRGRDAMHYDPNLMPLWDHEQYEQFIAPRG